MKVGDAIRFSNSSVSFAVVIKERQDTVALMFKNGDIKWFKKDSAEAINEDVQ